MKRRLIMIRGFSFVEIMVVVAIMAVLVGIAMPNLLQSRLKANEQSAISNIQAISVAAQTYWSGGDSGSVAIPLPTSLNQLYAQSYIDVKLGCASEPCDNNGYQYSMGGTGTSGSFFVYAVPKTANVTGKSSFCAGSDSTVRVNTAGATPASQAACTAWNPL